MSHPKQIKATGIDPISLRSTWRHRAWVAAGSIAILMSLYKAISNVSSLIDLVTSFIAGLIGYFLADIGTGFYHWAIDNYGGPSTPIFGPQIVGFQGHHQNPYKITRQEACNNLHELAQSVVFVLLPINFLFEGNSASHTFMGVFAGCVMLSQQFHAWAHEKKHKLPPGVSALQGAGILLSRSQHSAHHHSRFNSNYCIVSGAWNGILNGLRVFDSLEMVIFYMFGVRPRSWNEPQKKWREDYYAFE